MLPVQGLQLAEDAVNTWAKNTKLYWMMWGPLAKPMVNSIEGMVDGCAESAKAYWRLWGPLGEPMVDGIDAWAGTQRSYFQWLKEDSRVRG